MVDFTYVAGNQGAKLAMIALNFRQVHYMKHWKHT